VKVRQEPSKSLMINPDEANEPAYTAAHAIAGFQLADIAFGVLVRNGILPKSDAERLLKQAIAANRTGDPGHQAAAELLTIVLQTFQLSSASSPIERPRNVGAETPTGGPDSLLGWRGSFPFADRVTAQAGAVGHLFARKARKHVRRTA